MFLRLLLSPAGAEGNGTTPAAQTDQSAAADPATQAAAQAADPNAPFLARIRKLEDTLSALATEKAERERADTGAKEKGLKDKGDYEALIRARDEKIASIETKLTERENRFRATERDRAITEAIASTGKELVPGAAKQLLALWRNEFEAAEEDGAFSVTTKDFKTPAQVARERLASEEYAHFVKAAARGQGARGSQRAVDTRLPAQQGQPATLLEAIIAKRAEAAGEGVAAMERPQGFRSFVRAR